MLIQCQTCGKHSINGSCQPGSFVPTLLPPSWNPVPLRDGKAPFTHNSFCFALFLPLKVCTNPPHTAAYRPCSPCDLSSAERHSHRLPVALSSMCLPSLSICPAPSHTGAQWQAHSRCSTITPQKKDEWGIWDISIPKHTSAGLQVLPVLSSF